MISLTRLYTLDDRTLGWNRLCVVACSADSRTVFLIVFYLLRHPSVRSKDLRD